MRIAIDLSIARVNQAGTAVYATNLLEALRRLESGDTFRVFAVNQQRDMGEPKRLRTRLDTLYRDVIWTHGVLPWLVSRAKVDLLHMPANVMSILPPCPTIVSILDTTILQTPRNFPFWHRNYSRLFVPWAAKHASVVITISEHSRQDILERFKIAPDRVAVTYPAASPRFRVIARRESAEVKERHGLDRFILTVGTLEPRKNLVRLLRAYARLRQRGIGHQLVHAGPRGWLFDDVIAEVHKLALEDSVRFLGRVPLDDLLGLYNAADLFVYPSLYEGFGLPVLEAMACGCPVVTSNTSSLPEVAGEAAIIINPHNVGELADAIQQVLEDKHVSDDLRSRGLERAGLFSWERCAQETLAVYRQVVGT